MKTTPAAIVATVTALVALTCSSEPETGTATTPDKACDAVLCKQDGCCTLSAGDCVCEEV